MNINTMFARTMVALPLLAVAVCANSAGEDAASALPLALGADMASVMAGETVTRSSADGEDARSIVPQATALYAVLSDIPSGKNGFAVASVSYLPCAEGADALGAPGDAQNGGMVYLYNALLSVSTQEGITYISRREGMKPKVLFEKSYFIDGYTKGEALDGLVPAQDCKVTAIPPCDTRYAYQEDSSFGGNVYRYDITFDGNTINAHITNETAMKYHGVTCLKEGELSMFVQLAPAASGVIINTAAIIRGHKSKMRVLFISVDLSSSFARRTRALHDWYKGQIIMGQHP